jgi:hypothetical protein
VNLTDELNLNYGPTELVCGFNSAYEPTEFNL